MNHLAVTSILTVVAHIIWFASMTERKYPIKKTVLLYGLYAIFFTVWTILAYSLLGKDSPYVIPFSFVGTILPAILLFLYTSSDSFSKKIFLILTYANLFCIIICLSISICDGLFPNLSIVKQMYIRSLVRILLIFLQSCCICGLRALICVQCLGTGNGPGTLFPSCPFFF